MASLTEPVATAAYRPPAPRPLPATPALIRSLLRGERDLLSLMPRDAFRMRVGRLGFSRRGILLINDPALVRAVMTEHAEALPKNDLFVGALAPLVGDSIFVSRGARWRMQRRMIEPAFTHIQISSAFDAMSRSLDAFEDSLARDARAGAPLSLDAAMSWLTADIISRATFSTSLENETAREIFDAFAQFQASVANVEIARLILGRPFAPVRQPPEARAAARRIRAHVRALVAPRLSPRAAAAADGPRDIAADVIAARDPESGRAFDLDELVDQIGVFFLAGHETTACALTWAFFLLSQQPALAARLRAEVEETTGGGAVTLEAVKRMALTRAVFRETMRLYPPLPFLPRVALAPMRLGDARLRRGAMAMIAPWVIHRHPEFWPRADRFEPERFLGAAERAIPAGAYLPFGLGPRICVGAAFATIEATLILARLTRRFALTPLAPERVRPAVRLTTRPAEDVMVRASVL
ncbi:MAG: cytochrome P450 [Pseudomonadota bacterium]